MNDTIYPCEKTHAISMKFVSLSSTEQRVHANQV